MSLALLSLLVTFLQGMMMKDHAGWCCVGLAKRGLATRFSWEAGGDNLKKLLDQTKTGIGAWPRSSWELTMGKATGRSNLKRLLDQTKTGTEPGQGPAGGSMIASRAAVSRAETAAGPGRCIQGGAGARHPG